MTAYFLEELHQLVLVFSSKTQLMSTTKHESLFAICINTTFNSGSFPEQSRPGAIFTTRQFLCNLRMSPRGQSVTLLQVEKACQGQTLQLLGIICKLQRKRSVVNTAPTDRTIKLFTCCNLRIFVISQSVCPWQVLPAQSYICG